MSRLRSRRSLGGSSSSHSLPSEASSSSSSLSTAAAEEELFGWTEKENIPPPRRKKEIHVESAESINEEGTGEKENEESMEDQHKRTTKRKRERSSRNKIESEPENDPSESVNEDEEPPQPLRRSLRERKPNIVNSRQSMTTEPISKRSRSKNAKSSVRKREDTEGNVPVRGKKAYGAKASRGDANTFHIEKGSELERMKAFFENLDAQDIRDIAEVDEKYRI